MLPGAAAPQLSYAIEAPAPFSCADRGLRVLPVMRLARVRARRALRRLCGQLLERVDADLGGQRAPALG
jgi:hypothetical protein